MVTAEQTTAIEPPIGIHENVPMETYLSWEACSAHRLIELRRSALHCRYAIDNPTDPTDAMILGHLIGAQLLEPNEVDKRFVRSERCQEQNKSGGHQCNNPGKCLVGGKWLCGVHVKKDRHEALLTEAVASFKRVGWTVEKISDFGSHYLRHSGGARMRISNHAPSAAGARRMKLEGMQSIRVDLPPYGSDDPRIVITPDLWQRAVGATQATMRHPRAFELIEARTDTELSIVWRDKETGLLCKARPDFLSRIGATFNADLKTTEDASPRRFKSKIADLGYHVQQAMYRDALKAFDIDVADFALIVPETQPPHGVMVFQLQDDVMEQAGREVQSLRRQYAECLESDNWPGYSDAVELIDLPRWARE